MNNKCLKLVRIDQRQMRPTATDSTSLERETNPCRDRTLRS